MIRKLLFEGLRDRNCLCVHGRPQRALMSSVLDIYCTRWRTADRQTACPSSSTPLPPPQLWVCKYTHTHTHILYFNM